MREDLTSVIVVALALATPLAYAAQGEHALQQVAAPAASARGTMTNGVVKRIDKAAGNVTITHEALTDLGMPAMTMTFAVKDRAWLDWMKEGAKIRFTAANANGVLTVVALAPVK